VAPIAIPELGHEQEMPEPIPLVVKYPLAYIDNTLLWKSQDFGRMTIICGDCGAFHWIAERIIHEGKRNPKFHHCCMHGDVQIPLLRPLPQPLHRLLNSLEPDATDFRSKIRSWNSAFAFTSVSFNMDNREAVTGPGVQNFQIHGELYHLQGPLKAPGAEDALYSQMYLYDPQYALRLRSERFSTLNPELVQQITGVLYDCSPWISIYRTATERLRIEEQAESQRLYSIILNPRMELIVNGDADPRRANLPTVDEVAIIVPEEYGEKGFRDIVLAKRSINNEGVIVDQRFSRINQNHAAYLPLHYVIMFPRGETGWHWALELNNPHGERQRLRLGQRSFYRFRLHTRQNEPDTIFRCQKLFQQLVVDIWAVSDQNKLMWIRNHQANLRADLYNGLTDILQRDDTNIDPAAIGKKVILPSSYLGGDRFMQQIFQDSMAIVRQMGRPSLFITFTANPKWDEIVYELLPGQAANDRPDLVARVFHMKQQAMLQEIKNDHIFGKCRGVVWTIEYQKRGLPHMHLLVFLDTDPTFLTAENIDRLISAELPDETTEHGQQLGIIIKGSMVHTQCAGGNKNALCMKSSGQDQPQRCSKRYPREFQEETIVQANGYPLYRRRNSGKSFTIMGRGTATDIPVTIDNRYVVPYNPYLTGRYKAHVNVEICGSVQAIKYIHKYIYKGSDQSAVQVLSEKDEVKRYLNGRYIGPTDAMWRLFEFKVHEELPPVIHLSIHLPGEQAVYFPEGIDIQELQERVQTKQL